MADSIMTDSIPAITLSTASLLKKKQKPNQPEKPERKKLPRLPNNHKISKRPLLHPPISSPYSSSTTSQKIIYISSTTPFITTIKRIRKYLSSISNRLLASTSTSTSTSRKANNLNNANNRTSHLRNLMNTNESVFLKGIEESVKERGEGEEVLLKATGKAVQNLLAVAVWLENEAEGMEFVVRVRTGTVGAVDDVVAKEGEADEGAEVASQVRRMSCLEVGVRLRGF